MDTSLSEYDIQVKNDQWEFPSYRNRCPICRRADCAVGYGFYYRQAFTEDNKSLIPDLPIKRFICRLKRVTFSLLPYHLIPYRKYPIRTASYVMDIWRKLKCRVSRTVTNIFRGEEVHEGLFNIDISCVYEFMRLFKDALRKYKIWQEKDYLIEEFIDDCHQDNYHQSELLGIGYYEGNGGYLNNSHFLFGKASQFRAAPS